MNYISLILLFLIFLPTLFFTLSLIPISIINRYFRKNELKATCDEKKINLSNEKYNPASQSLHGGIVGFCGRSILSYIDYVNLRTAYIPFHFIRMFIYKNVFLLNVHKDVDIHYGGQFLAAHKIKIGRGTCVGFRCVLDGRNTLEIGENVNLSSDVNIFTNQHDYKSSDFGSYNEKRMGVRIGNYAWLCTGCFILPGVTIGEGSVVAAHSVVTHDVEPYTVVAGIPAKKVSDRPKNLNYSLHYSNMKFW